MDFWMLNLGELPLFCDVLPFWFAKIVLRLFTSGPADMVTHASNPSYSGDRDRIVVWCQARQKSVRPCLKNKLEWWCTPVIPDTQKVEIGGPWFKTVPDKVSVKNKLQTKWLGTWTCLASSRLWLQSPVPWKNRKECLYQCFWGMLSVRTPLHT
jgi:nitric oxide synthase oxygenase domain/subunit